MHRVSVMPLPLCLLAIVLLAACAAPVPATGEAARAELAPPATGHASSSQQRVAPPMSDPLPPQRLEVPTAGSTAPAAAGDEVTVDRSCRSNADCTVKNVGNCCGYYPACVNVDSPTDPAGVQARCAEQGMASVCGFPTISSCECVSGQCEGSNAAVLE